MKTEFKFNYRQDDNNGHWWASTNYRSGYFCELGDTKQEAKNKLMAAMKRVLSPSDEEVVTINY